MDIRIAARELFQKFRVLWFAVEDQPEWSRPIWKILLIAVPAFILVDLLLLFYIILILIMKALGIDLPFIW